MSSILNNAILPLVNQGKLSMSKVNELISLKDFVDRNSARKFLVGETPEGMLAKYGAIPDVITWGDYFQTELASDAVTYSDEEFAKVCDTVKFDIMSAFQIFSEQSAEFFEWVEKGSHEIIMHGAENYSEEELEVLHLKVIKDYYLNLGILDNFTPEEILWYNSFSQSSEEAAGE